MPLAMLLISSMMMTVLPTPAPPEEAYLAPFEVWLQQVDNLDASDKHLLGSGELFEFGSLPVDRVLIFAAQPGEPVDRPPYNVE